MTMQITYSKFFSRIFSGIFFCYLLLILDIPLSASETGKEGIYYFNLDLRDWGGMQVDDIYQGQFALIHDRPKEYLELHALYPRLQSGSERPDSENPVKNQIPSPAGIPFALSIEPGKNVNNLGGRFGAYQRSPSSAQVHVTRETISLSYHREAEGFCGMWIHLFDSAAQPGGRIFLNSQSYHSLAFRIRGRQGDEVCSLRVADNIWLEKEDSIHVGEVAPFTPSGKIEREWTPVEIPLDRFPASIQRQSLASLIVSIDKPGESAIEIKDICFQVGTPQSKEEIHSAPNKIQPLPHKKQTATWVWNTPDILAQKEDEETLIRFLTGKKIDLLFLQIPAPFYSAEFNDESLQSLKTFRTLMASLTQAGIQVSALDGGRDYGHPENHGTVLTVLSHILQYNQSVPSNERFIGVHYDIEPHALPGFGSTQRQEFLIHLLSLYEKMAIRLRDTDLVLGVDIPFWYDSSDELTGKSNQVIFQGKYKNVCHHILDRVSYAVLMDYRTYTEKPDGIIANAKEELEYTSRIGKPLFIALETRPVLDQTLYRFKNTPSKTVPDPFPPNGLLILQTQLESIQSILCTSFQSFQAIKPNLQANAAHRWFWPIESAIFSSGAKISFASHGIQFLQKVLNETEANLNRYPSFQGFAIHDYVHYKNLCQEE